ncbi:hypothetical protein EDI_154750 [Entamoeba dispar SAW760]|uniref:Peptidase S74 domain-containing protein n=1 Tax=Entamoeba dispar (strain ATCC PRA-260 / SAW760) TaxID=370354 RepID=B0ECB9_ENTDS|nr:uncharacterized protein EDI_154750 [Entamoeba dispar SAW760]EDR27843.1 hypothetical protein EDI_154750 [Entamoeba dispar SAW760]|eukprot:EDR27843.1 hypothetical protein EDI_154750 [Entamoeba dispar SAW760]
MNGGGGIVNVPVKEIPRTLKQRKKNWKCNYPGCNETPKTRYNCYAHLWDLHLKQIVAEEGNNPDNILITSFKNSNEKDKIKKICERYMIKLVDKTQGRQTYPFAFTETLAPIIGVALNQLQNKEKMNKEKKEDKKEFLRYKEINKTDSETTENILNNSQEYQIIEEKNKEEYQINELLKIKRIRNKVQQLYMLGEIFSNEGFLVRSDKRNKKEIEKINNALYGIKHLYGREFKYLTDLENKTPRYGFIAQEVKKIYPELVEIDEEGGLTVDYLGIIPIMVEALKEIEKENEKLKKNKIIEIENLNLIIKKTIKELITIEKEFKEQKNKILKPIYKKEKKSTISHCFGPTYFIIFMSILFSISSIIVPLISSVYLIEIILIFITCILWIFVIINNSEVKELIIKKESLKEIFKQNNWWSILQFIIWSIIITLIISSIIITLIIGIMGILISILYIISFISLLTILLLIYFNCSHIFYRNLFISIVFSSFHIITFIALILFISLQPFYYFELTHYNILTSIQTNVNQTIIPIPLPSLPWNCYNPTFIYSIPLPNELELEIESKYINRITPYLQGKVTQKTNYIGLIKVQCGITKIDYTTIHLNAY